MIPSYKGKKYKGKHQNNSFLQSFGGPSVIIPIIVLIVCICLEIVYDGSGLTHQNESNPIYAKQSISSTHDISPTPDDSNQLAHTDGTQVQFEPVSDHTLRGIDVKLSDIDDSYPLVGPVDPKEAYQIAICVTTADTLPNIKRWMRYHQLIGVTHFYLFVEGQANFPNMIEQLQQYKNVLVFPDNADLKYKHDHSRAWHENWLSSFFNKPCNAELFVRQSLNMEIAIQQAQHDGIKWILHVDTDELINPGGTTIYSLTELLKSQPYRTDVLVFPNYEALPEREDITDPYVQVSLFKKAYGHILSDQYFRYYKDVAHNNPNYFITYGNGKSAARVQPHLRSNGAHRWQNYKKRVKEQSAKQASVLHFTYNKYSDLVSRRDRCDCAPTKKDVQRCFFLPFDREAFVASSTMNGTELREFYKDRLVWQDPDTIILLQKAGLFMRIYTPMVILSALDNTQDFYLPKREAGQSTKTVMDGAAKGKL